MKKSIEEINSRLDTIETKKNETIKKSRSEVKAYEEKIKQLEEETQTADELEDYQAKKDELEKARDSLSFLQAKAKKAMEAPRPGMFITKQEFDRMSGEIRAEALTIQEAAAPGIQKAFFEIIEAMDNYTAKVNELEAVHNKLNILYNYMHTNTVLACDIANQTPDTNKDLWEQFVWMYYRLYGDRMRAAHAARLKLTKGR